MIVLMVIMGLFVLGGLLTWAYEAGKINGSKKQLEKVGKGVLLGAITLTLPREDFQAISTGYYQESATAAIELRRADRIEIEVKDCTHRTVGLAALFGGGQ